MMFTRNIGKTLTSSFPDTGEPQTPHSNHATVAEGSLKKFSGPRQWSGSPKEKIPRSWGAAEHRQHRRRTGSALIVLVQHTRLETGLNENRTTLNFSLHDTRLR